MTTLNYIRVVGHSGFSVELINENTVRKAAAHGAESERLRRQINKQITFQAASLQGRIRAPEVRRQIEASGAFSAEMEFVAGKDFVQFLTEANHDELDDFAKLMVDFIYDNLARSASRDVTGLIEEKAKELANRGVAHKYVEAALALCANPIRVPVGPCHGDLTFSNMLFKGKQLYLIDFLDPFVESPIQDVVKLRQDTHFGWSLDMYQADFDRTKTRIVLNYLDHLIEEAFAAFDWYANHYVLFQLMNLMRILPYCKNANAKVIVMTHLDRLLATNLMRPISTVKHTHARVQS
jgi:hypothetical protein